MKYIETRNELKRLISHLQSVVIRFESNTASKEQAVAELAVVQKKISKIEQDILVYFN